MFLRIALIVSLSCLPPALAWAQAQPEPSGAVVKTPGLNVQVQFYGESTVRIRKWLPQGAPAKKSLVVVQKKLPALELYRQDSPEGFALSSKALKVLVSKQDGSVSFLKPSGRIVLKEAGKAVLAPVEYRGDKGLGLQQRFTLTPDEGIYGLGQHQDGIMNHRGRSLTLVQANTQSAIPFLVSTQGWGLLWDNPSKTIFADGPDGLTVK